MPLSLTAVELRTLIVTHGSAMTNAVANGTMGKALLMKVLERLTVLAAYLPEDEQPVVPEKEEDEDVTPILMRH